MRDGDAPRLSMRGTLSMIGAVSRDLVHEARQWKSALDMYRRAWARELDGAVMAPRKTHEIDELVMLTQLLRQERDRFRKELGSTMESLRRYVGFLAFAKATLHERTQERNAALACDDEPCEACVACLQRTVRLQAEDRTRFREALRGCVITMSQGYDDAAVASMIEVAEAVLKRGRKPPTFTDSPREADLRHL